MAGTFHQGELEVQQRAGVGEQAARIAGSIHEVVPPVARAFLAARRFVVLATADPAGRPWASWVTGSAGFADAPEPGRLRLEANPLPGDPLAENLETTELAGLLAIDFASRKRMRVNGRIRRESSGSMEIATRQVYSNCPKYIQRRAAAVAPDGPRARLVGRGEHLTRAQCGVIRRADTFFIATLHPGEGADASHRGGAPGFVSVEGDRLTWPDYAGNLMYNTLGNIAAYPRAGLLFPDFETGSVIQLTGRAAIEWDPARAAAVPGAERLVVVEVEEVVEIAGAFRPMEEAPEYSPFNPPVSR